MKKSLIYLSLFILFGLLSCNKDTEEPVVPEPVEESIAPDLALKWVELTNYTIKNSPDNSPTYASRSLGYIGLTMYESVVNGSIIYKSVASELNGFSTITPPEAGKKMDWEIALNAGQFEIIQSMYPHAPEELVFRLDSLYKAVLSQKKGASVAQDVIDASDLYGKQVARQIFEWSKLDKGFEGYKISFDINYQYPRGPTYWFPPSFGQSNVLAPMHPYWGKNRTFIKANSEMAIPVFIPSSKDPNGEYFKEMELVYNVNKALTQEEKEIALWWGDDPSASASPPGHSYYLNSLLVKSKNTNLFEAASSFAKVGMSVADAFINVWKCKYFYHSERPKNYININIDISFVQFWPEPPFPAFTSGHSTQSAAAATAMISVFGDENTIVDKFHTGRPTDIIRQTDFKTREFNSIWKIAEECGWSRILGGIHTPQDNRVGLAEGKKIGENINSLHWKY